MTEEELNSTPFVVGDRVEWSNAYPHLREFEPFEIYKIKDGWAMLKWVSVPVRLRDLKKVDKC